jgi:hypothetical protein
VDDFLQFLLLCLGSLDEARRAAAVLDWSSPESMQEAAPHGLGFQIRHVGNRKVVAHAGGNRGWSAAFVLLPESKSGLVVLTNGSSGNAIINVAQTEWARIFHELDLPRVARPAAEFPIQIEPEKLQRAKGKYQAPNGTVWEFRVVGDHLKAYAGAENMFVYPRGDSDFFAYPLSSGYSFRFVFDNRGWSEAVLLGTSASGPWTRLPRVES